VLSGTQLPRSRAGIYIDLHPFFYKLHAFWVQTFYTVKDKKWVLHQVLHLIGRVNLFYSRYRNRYFQCRALMAPTSVTAAGSCFATTPTTCADPAKAATQLGANGCLRDTDGLMLVLRRAVCCLRNSSKQSSSATSPKWRELSRIFGMSTSVSERVGSTQRTDHSSTAEQGIPQCHDFAHYLEYRVHTMTSQRVHTTARRRVVTGRLRSMLHCWCSSICLSSLVIAAELVTFVCLFVWWGE
jgi:hypothetical protein